MENDEMVRKAMEGCYPDAYRAIDAMPPAGPCFACVWWDPIRSLLSRETGKPGMGYCRGKLPERGAGGFAKWPVTRDTDWCAAAKTGGSPGEIRV